MIYNFFFTCPHFFSFHYSLSTIKTDNFRFLISIHQRLTIILKINFKMQAIFCFCSILFFHYLRFNLIIMFFFCCYLFLYRYLFNFVVDFVVVRHFSSFLLLFCSCSCECCNFNVNINKSPICMSMALS